MAGLGSGGLGLSIIRSIVSGVSTTQLWKVGVFRLTNKRNGITYSYEMNVWFSERLFGVCSFLSILAGNLVGKVSQ